MSGNTLFARGVSLDNHRCNWGKINKAMLLIVDDNKQIRRMIRSLVEDLDSDIFECEDGMEAVSACEQRQPDWVLMDVQMSPMDGLTATRKIKSFFPQTKIAIVTNHDDSKTRKAATDAGASAFFNKDNLMWLRDLIGNKKVVQVKSKK